MAIIIRIIPLLILPVLLFGCATTAPSSLSAQSTAQNKHIAIQDESDPASNYPPVELSGDILYGALLAEIAVQRGQYDVAVEQYLYLAEATKDPRLIERATRVALFARDDESVLQGARLWFEIDPENIAARQAIAAAHIRLGQLDEALEHLEYILLSESENPENAYMLVASLLSRDQDVQTALQGLQQLVEEHGDNKAILFAYGQMALRAKDLDNADDASSRLLSNNPEWRSAIILRTRVLLLQGKPQAAVDFIAKKIKQLPYDTTLRLAYARTLIDVQRLDDAVIQFEKVAQQTPDNAEVLMSLGLLMLQRNQLDDAKKYIQRAGKFSARLDDINFYLGQIEEKKGETKAAIDYYATVMGGENLMNARIRSVLLTVEHEGVDPARDQLHVLQKHLPSQRAQLYLVEGEILRQAGMYDEAMVFYNEALEETPQSIELLYARATVAESINRLDIVEQDLTAILEQESDNADALNALGYLLADRTTRYQEAYDYIKRALELRPQDNAIIDSMGWVLYRLGRHQEAIDYLQQSLAIRHDPEVAAHLGEVLWVMGEEDRARGIWEQALEESPGDKKLLEIMGRFVH